MKRDMERWATAALVLGMSCCTPWFGNNDPQFELPLNPPPIYQAWYISAATCVMGLLDSDSTHLLNYKLNMNAPASVLRIKWTAVPTEAHDGSFPCTRRNDRCWGETVSGDSVTPHIRLSGRLLGVPSLVKHELMHVLVDKGDAEQVKEHGLPWGFCEWL